MRISVVGAVGVEGDSGELIDAGGLKQRTVLAVLAAHVGEFVSVDRISEALWGDEIPDRAARSVSTYISNLRKVLVRDIESKQGLYRLDVDRSSIDLTCFFDALDAAEMASDEERVDLVTAALNSASGVPFAGIEDHGVLRPIAIDYSERRVEAEKVVLGAEAASPSASTLSRLDVLVHDHPHDEELRSIHMRALYAAGRHVDALASFRDLEQALRDDLGLEPSKELRELELRVLEHTLDDKVDNGESEPHSLVNPTPAPRRYASLVGRESDLEDLSLRMTDGRLVSVIGAGGIGKSTLVAEAVRDPGSDVSVAWVSLEAVPSDEVGMAVAQAVGLQPAGSVDPIDALVRYLETRIHIVVLDGCEKAVSSVTAVTRILLERTDARIIATSREPLGIMGESVIRVDPLAVEASVELFLERAEIPKDVDRDVLDSVRDVCSALDGMPLAVELAASRARSLPLDRIAQRMTAQLPLLKRPRTFDERHGSMLAALDWSYDLLSEPEQETLQATSVFRSPFVIEDVIGLMDRNDADDDLARLVDVSMVRYDRIDGTFRLLEPIRQYAAFRAETEGRSDIIHNQHAEMLALGAEMAEQKSWTPETLEAWQWMFDKRADLQAATVWSADHGDGMAALRICGAIGRRLVSSGIHTAFTDPIERALSKNSERDDPVVAKAMVPFGWMIWREGHYSDGLRMVEQALAKARSIGDDEVEAIALLRHAVVAYPDSGIEESLAEIDQAISILERLGGRQHTFQGLFNRAALLSSAGRHDDAEEWALKLRARSRQIVGYEHWGSLSVIADIQEARGDLEAALDTFRQAATASDQQVQYFHSTNVWLTVADLAERLGRPSIVRDALEHVRQIDLLTGRTSPMRDILEASLDDDSPSVLAGASVWLDWVREPFFERPALPGLADHSVLGTEYDTPLIFGILVHVARALYAVGDTDAACRIVASARHLMDSSRFTLWEERRELERWEGLIRDCAEFERTDLPVLELDDLFDYLVEHTRPFSRSSEDAIHSTPPTPR